MRGATDAWRVRATAETTISMPNITWPNIKAKAAAVNEMMPTAQYQSEFFSV
jgi:hypothetical protein